MAPARNRNARQPPPLEKEGLRWKEYTRSYKHALHLFMSLNERRRWMKNPRLSDFRAFSCGHYVEAHGMFWEREGLDEGVYIYCVAGRGYYRQGGKEWTINAGDLLYCMPLTHHCYAADEANPWTIHWMHVSGNKVKHYERLLGVSANNPTIHLGIQPEIIYLFNMLYRLFRPVYDDQHLQAIWACAQLLLSQIAIVPTSAALSPRQIHKIQDILDYMDRAVEADLDLGHFAATAGVTPEHFSRLFKKVTGFSPIDYFLRLKIRTACSLLATTDLLVKQIAFQLAFHDHTHLTHLFKKIIGLAPDQYRKNFLAQPPRTQPNRTITGLEKK